MADPPVGKRKADDSPGDAEATKRRMQDAFVATLSKTVLGTGVALQPDPVAVASCTNSDSGWSATTPALLAPSAPPAPQGGLAGLRALMRQQGADVRSARTAGTGTAGLGVAATLPVATQPVGFGLGVAAMLPIATQPVGFGGGQQWPQQWATGQTIATAFADEWPEEDTGAIAPALDQAVTEQEAGQQEAALQMQLSQQQNFQMQLRSYEAARGGLPKTTRFKEGYMPLQMCGQLAKFGNCRRGEGCTFAHDLSELHPASAELHTALKAATLTEQETPSFLNQQPKMQMKKKRELCGRYTSSGCQLGDLCIFAHSEEDLGKVMLVIAEERVKRIICKHWEANRCGYGDYCLNAHGIDQIGKMKPPEEYCPRMNK